MFKKLKDKLKNEDRESSTHTQQSQLHPSNPYYIPPQQQDAGSSEKYHPPPGPPPNQSSSSSSYVPPPGPPPSHSHQQHQQPPSAEPPPYHDWTIIPDNSLLPPPPSMGYETSPTANASEEEGARAAAWTRANPLWQPANLTPAQHASIQNHQLTLLKPPTLTGELLPQPQPGHWKCRTHTSCRDSCILTSLPAYSAPWDSPLHTQRPKTIYFELKITAIGRNGVSSFSEADAGIAIGFVAPPYPTFRLPGWQRGSLGVHGDDGRKYVNDTYGGIDFTRTFKPGEVVGIGMTFSLPRDPPSYDQERQGRRLDIDVFFTRDGVREGGWDGNEELDERSVGGAEGLRGECDLFPAVGVFGGVDFEVFFSPENWLFNPF